MQGKHTLRRLVSMARFIFRSFLHDDCRQNAASLTYTTLFAVVPMMTVLFAVLSGVPALQRAGTHIQNFIFTHFLPDTGVKIQEYLGEFSRQASNLTAVGVLMLFVTALLMLMTIEKAFNEIWKVRQPRQNLVSFLRYWAVLSLGPLLLGVAFTVSSYLTSIRLLSGAEEIVGIVLPGLQIMPLLFTGLAFTLLYVTVPNCKVPLKAGFGAGFFAAALFELAKRVFGLFVSNFSSYQLVYGAFAAFPLFLLWIYMSWMIILLGVEVSRALTLYKEQHYTNRHPVLAILDILQLFYRRQKDGHSVSDTEAMSILGRYEVETWTEMAAILVDLNYIKKTENGNYVLVRNLDQIDFWSFYQHLPWPLPKPEDLKSLHADDNWARALAPHFIAAHEQSGRALALPLGKILAVD